MHQGYTVLRNKLRYEINLNKMVTIDNTMREKIDHYLSLLNLKMLKQFWNNNTETSTFKMKIHNTEVYYR